MCKRRKTQDSKRLYVIKKNSERILAGITEIKRELAKLPLNLDNLINSLERCAKEMHRQSIRQRQDAERRRTTIFICSKEKE